MNITLSSGARTRFRNDVSAHRANTPATDKSYAEDILGVSLNTFKKILNPGDRGRLVLKRNTFVSICRAAELDPDTYDVPIKIAGKNTPFGSYERADYDYLEGTYIIQRRSFLTAENIVRGAVEISWDDRLHCLAFLERHSYTTDSGAPYETTYRGQLHIRRDRNIINMVQLLNGEARLTLVNTPDRPATGPGAKPRIKARGAVLTYGNPRDFYQPIVSAVVLEQVSTKTGGNLNQLCKTLKPGSDEFAQASADLKHAEDQTVVMTPLMWRKFG
jgi:hypothetical protein